MSNITVFNPNAMRPAFANAPLSAVALALMGTPSGKRLSVRGGVFRLIVDGKEVTAIEERYVDVVIVRAAPKVYRTFYAGAYVEGENKSPDCWSSNGDTPDKGVKSPQGASCAACPQNVKGSGQGETRACRFNQQLAVVLANDMEGDVLQLSCSATSIFGKGEGENRPLQDYVRYYGAQNVDIATLITRVRFDTTSATPKLFFKPARYLTQEEFDICQAQGATAEADRAVTMAVSNNTSAASAAPAVAAPAPITAPKPAAKPAAVKAAPAPEPEASGEDEPPPPPPKARKATPAAVAAKPAPVADDGGEPVVRKAPPAATAPAASSLASALAEWDDE